LHFGRAKRSAAAGMGAGEKRMGHTGKRGTTVLCLAALLSVGVAGALNASPQINRPGKSHRPASPLRFEASKSPSDSPFKYSAQALSYSLFLSSDEADVVLHGEQAPSGEVSRGKRIVVRAYAALLRMRFVDSNPPTSIAPVGREKQPARYYAAVAYRGIYPGTDVIVGGDEQRMRFQLNLSPGSDADHIVLEIAGATSIRLNSAGDAILYTGARSLVLPRPMVQFGGGANSRSVLGAYRIESGNRLRFIVGASGPENNQTTTD
jgi:hypothetical protein